MRSLFAALRLVRKRISKEACPDQLAMRVGNSLV
jgi:hypothetical protein